MLPTHAMDLTTITSVSKAVIGKSKGIMRSAMEITAMASMTFTQELAKNVETVEAVVISKFIIIHELRIFKLISVRNRNGDRRDIRDRDRNHGRNWY
jgi:hypothetical protein